MDIYPDIQKPSPFNERTPAVGNSEPSEQISGRRKFKALYRVDTRSFDEKPGMVFLEKTSTCIRPLLMLSENSVENRPFSIRAEKLFLMNSEMHHFQYEKSDVTCRSVDRSPG